MEPKRPLTGTEKEVLRVSLDRHRDALLWKAAGLTDEDLRRHLVPSGTTLLGLIKHVAWVEYGWFCDTFGRPSAEDPFDEDDPESDMRIEADESTAEVLAFAAGARATADLTIAELALDDTGTSWRGETVSLRWVMVHMVEEVARHAGHADILRELIDGATGDHKRD